MKKVTFAATLAGCLGLAVMQAQQEGNIWHFGQGAALDFNSGSAVITTPSSMWTFEGCASIADADGNLLFYSNGGGRDPILSGQSSGKIWNRNHQVMYDMGNTEGGGFSAAQSAVIVPRPGLPGRYYLFTMDEVEFDVGGSVPTQPLGRGLSYFDIDMTLNGGLGGVVSYTEMILVPSYEGLCAVRHQNGSDYWIIVHNDTLGLAVFPVTASGVGTPATYNFPGGTGGVIKGSPDGQWLTCFSLNGGGQTLFGFNASTGAVSNPLPLGGNVETAEFSPNSKRLFGINSDKNVLFFDLTSPNIPGSQSVVTQLPAFGSIVGQMQLAPDGKIYFVESSFQTDTTYLSAIVCPNTAPFVESRPFAFPGSGGISFVGLPNFDNAIFRRDVDPPLPVELGPDQTICNDQTVTLDAGIGGANYSWSNGAQTQTLQVNVAGTYIVTVTAQGCGVGVDTVVVEKISLDLEAGPDLEVCAGESIQLEASGNGTLLWSPAGSLSNPGITTPLFTGNSSTTLLLTATQGTCTAQDSVRITVQPVPVAGIAPGDTTIDSGSAVQLNGTGDGTFLWSPAGGLSCTDCPNPVATPDSTTTYELLVTNAAGCSSSISITITVTPPDCTPDLPNAFTPNGDAVNDVFRPIGAAIESYELIVFNRWGQQVFNGDTAWDGRESGQDAPSDVYVYRMSVKVCGVLQAFTGDVTLIR